jgi:hypothetical protein
MSEVKDSVRRNAGDPLIVYDMTTNIPIGQIINLSRRGMRLMSETPMEVNRIYYCRMPLPETLLKRDEIFFDAECRWCLKNEDTGWYDSGYVLRKASPEDTDIIKLLIHRWMIQESEKINHTPTRAKKRPLDFLIRILDNLFS